MRGPRTLRDRGIDLLSHKNRIADEQFIRNTQQSDSARFEIARSLAIIVAHPMGLMMYAIELDDELQIGAVEVDDVGANRNLSSKFESAAAAIAKP